ncbi:hypothetical protein OAO41_01835 [Euryarchaeota archaeon]|jgi:hypothetical protein|nr:hypothetical protein [Euryarchaeota archaeon]|tara:strand:- start:315 stop:710 length:396 start_codon:yes stop_codon:yes gene_type:complete
MYKIISQKDNSSIKQLFSAPFAFSSSVTDEEHLKIGRICNEMGFIDVAYAHYSAVIENKNADKISLKSSKLLISELKKNHPLIGKNIKVETIKLVEKKSIFNRLGETIISELLKIIVISIFAFLTTWIYLK